MVILLMFVLALMFSVNLMIICNVLFTPVFKLVGAVVAIFGAVLSIVYVCEYIGDLFPARSIIFILQLHIMLMVIFNRYLMNRSLFYIIKIIPDDTIISK